MNFIPSPRRLLSSLAIIVVVVFAFISLLIMRAEPAQTHTYFAADAGRRLVIAHRGGASLRPENTLAAFAYADEIGADILEMDVRHTADNQLVIMHDANVDRTTNATGDVGTLTLAEIKRLDAGYRWSATGETFTSYDDFSDYPFRGKGINVPTLEEVYESFPTKRIVIEIKQGEPAWVADKLCATIRRHERTQTTLVASVNHTTLTRFRLQCPEVATSASSDEARNFLALGFTHLTATYSPAFQALQVPPTLGSLPIITREFVEAAHHRRLVVHPWTINDEPQMRRLLDVGVDGIITDRPDLLIRLLRNPD